MNDEMEKTATIEHLFIAPAPGEPRVGVECVTAVAGEGLVGDRYFGEPPHRYAATCQITLIEAEAVERVRASGRELTPAQTRRNVVTRGVELNDLVGRTFTVGEVRMRGVERCDPCSRLQKFTYRGVMRDLRDHGGLRAEILEGGEIRVGDELRVEEVPPPL